MREREREIFIENLLVRVHLIIETSKPALRHGSFEFPFPGSLISTFLRPDQVQDGVGALVLWPRHKRPLHRRGYEPRRATNDDGHVMSLDGVSTGGRVTTLGLGPPRTLDPHPSRMVPNGLQPK